MLKETKPSWAVDFLRKATLKEDIFKALDYFEYNDHVGFLEEMKRFEAFDTRPGGIGRILDDQTERFPYLSNALHASTAGSCYYTEPHPSGETDSMNYYIANSPYRSSSVVYNYIERFGHKLGFYDEHEYYNNYYEGKMQAYEPISNYPVGKVLEVLAGYEIALKEIHFYGLTITTFPPALIAHYPSTKIVLMNCDYQAINDPALVQLVIEERVEKLY